jgi:hypothetical protein
MKPIIWVYFAFFNSTTNMIGQWEPTQTDEYVLHWVTENYGWYKCGPWLNIREPDGEIRYKRACVK